MTKSIKKEDIREILQELYQAGDEGEPEESAVPHAETEINKLFNNEIEKEREKIITEIENAEQRSVKLNDKVSAVYVGIFLETLLNKIKIKN